MQRQSDSQVIQRIDRLNRLYPHPIPAYDVDVAVVQYQVLTGKDLLQMQEPLS